MYSIHILGRQGNAMQMMAHLQIMRSSIPQPPLLVIPKQINIAHNCKENISNKRLGTCFACVLPISGCILFCTMSNKVRTCGNEEYMNYYINKLWEVLYDHGLLVVAWNALGLFPSLNLFVKRRAKRVITNRWVNGSGDGDGGLMSDLRLASYPLHTDACCFQHVLF